MHGTEASDPPRWLLLIHQIPPTPGYLRVKIGRRLHAIGAVAVKNSVYAAPRTDAMREHLEWILREVVAGGGDASICEARFVEGLDDERLQAMFRAARDADYDALAGDVRVLAKELPRRGRLEPGPRGRIEGELTRLRRRLAEIVEIDFFGSSRQAAVERLLAGVESRLRSDGVRAQGGPPLRREDHRGRTWVTRAGIHVDRMASAWLIRRFIDPEARFRFVSAKGYRPEPGELRFDMFEGEFTHEGDLCTFEVLVARMGLSDPALRPIAEIVHDIDLRDGAYGRAETDGVALVVAAIAAAHRSDEERLARTSAVLDDLYELHRRKRS